MAKWINFHVTGGYDNSGAVAAEDGDNLLLADSILTVAVAANGAGDAMSATLTTATKTVTVLFSLDAAATDPGAASAKPASAGYINKVKLAITKAITANPGGVKSTVSLPQDSADNTAAYDFAKTVYFKSFKIA
jgi:hypothetical protein